MYKTFICLRYLAKKRITWFSVVSVLLGVMALVVVMGVMHGFTGFLRKSMRGMFADIVVRSVSSSGFDHYERLAEEIEKLDGVVATAPRLAGFGILKRQFAGQIDYKPIQFIGIIPDRENAVNDFKSQVGKPLDRDGNVQKHGDPDDPSSLSDFLGENMAGKNSGLVWDDPSSVPEEARDDDLVILGSQVAIYEPQLVGYMRVKIVTIEMERGEASSRMFRLANTFSSGNYEYDSGTAYITLDAAQTLTRMTNAVTEISVRTTVDNNNALLAISNRIQEIVDNADYIDLYRRPESYCWFQLNRTLLNAIDLETTTMYILLFLLLVVAGFATVAILTLIVLQKHKDVGVLMAMGADRAGIARIFLTFGLVIGIAGASLGVGAGVLFLWKLEPIRAFVSHFLGFDPFPATLYYFSEIPKEYDPLRIIKIWAAAVAICLLASLYPALRASRLNPVEIIRYE